MTRRDDLTLYEHEIRPIRAMGLREMERQLQLAARIVAAHVGLHTVAEARALMDEMQVRVQVLGCTTAELVRALGTAVRPARPRR